MRFAAILLLTSCSFGADLTVPSKDLYSGWLQMYDLKFDEAHQIFGEWKQSHPGDALGPASDAAAYLFSELARLGVLESELFVDDAKFKNRAKPQPDSKLKPRFDHENRADRTSCRRSAPVRRGRPQCLIRQSLELWIARRSRFAHRETGSRRAPLYQAGPRLHRQAHSGGSEGLRCLYRSGRRELFIESQAGARCAPCSG